MFVLNKGKSVIKFDGNILVPSKPVEVGEIKELKKKYPSLEKYFADKILVEVNKNQSINLAGEKVKEVGGKETSESK